MLFSQISYWEFTWHSMQLNIFINTKMVSHQFSFVWNTTLMLISWHKVKYHKPFHDIQLKFCIYPFQNMLPWFNILRPNHYWAPFCWWYFGMHFLQWKVLYFDPNFTEILFLNWGYILVIYQWQAITWPSNDQVLQYYFDGLVQERHNSSALAMELCLSCSNPWIWCRKATTSS